MISTRIFDKFICRTAQTRSYLVSVTLSQISAPGARHDVLLPRDEVRVKPTEQSCGTEAMVGSIIFSVAGRDRWNTMR